MSLRSTRLYAAALTCVGLCLGATSASAGMVTVTSYDMDNGDGQAQFGTNNYFDYLYTDNATGKIDPNANQNGSNLVVPTNSTPAAAPLTGGTGILTDGVIATQNWSLVTSANGKIASSPYTPSSLVGQPTEYVGWKYQDPTIDFHLTAGQTVNSISLYVASNSGGGLVAAPQNVVLTVGGHLISTTFSLTTMPGTLGNTDKITLSGFSISSSSVFDLQLMRGPLQQDGINYYNQYNCSTCGADTTGFDQEAAGGQTGPLAPGSGLEPWILLNQVQFFAAAVPEPSTWLMLVAGFAGLGVMGYRRRGRQQFALA